LSKSWYPRGASSNGNTVTFIQDCQVEYLLIHVPGVAPGHLVKGVVAQFCYVGAQVGVASFIIRFAQHISPGLTQKSAAVYLQATLNRVHDGQVVRLKHDETDLAQKQHNKIA
jgi:hypothetical protein